MRALYPAPEFPKSEKSLQQVFDELNGPEFLFIDRGCIVNIIQIMRVSGDTVVLKNGEKLPVSRFSSTGKSKTRSINFGGCIYDELVSGRFLPFYK